LGFGVWGLGFGGLGIGPNPQSPIPNPQSPIPNPHEFLLFKYKNYKGGIISIKLINLLIILNK